MNRILSGAMLYCMLLFAAPAVNAMRSMVGQSDAIVVFDSNYNRRRRNRMLERRYGFSPITTFSELSV